MYIFFLSIVPFEKFIYTRPPNEHGFFPQRSRDLLEHHAESL